MADFDKELDARDLASPLPVLRAKAALRELLPGQVLRLLASDQRTALDVGSFCKTAGHELVAQDHQDGVRGFLIRRRAD
ncbi:MAG: sulfurtransferase TusA family protein [Alphaproteobacteria bacterium]|nr:sulfurtransferase TusA family protein [Alphaproteobacteria bacterium]